MAEEKIYVGSGKKNKEFARNISVCLTDLPKEFIFEYNGKKYIKLNIVDKKQPDNYGKDVSVQVDTWKPEPKPAKEEKVSVNQQKYDFPEQSDLPF